MIRIRNMQPRLVRHATRFASTSASSARPFPPPEASSSVALASGRTFSPEAWASVQPPAPAALNSLAARVSLPSLNVPGNLDAVLTQALTHPSFVSLHKEHYPTDAPPPTNAALSTLGNSLLGLFASEFIHVSYPHLPTRVMKAAVSAYVGPRTCADISREWGASPMLRWQREVSLLIPGLLPHLPHRAFA